MIIDYLIILYSAYILDCSQILDSGLLIWRTICNAYEYLILEPRFDKVFELLNIIEISVLYDTILLISFGFRSRFNSKTLAER